MVQPGQTPADALMIGRVTYRAEGLEQIPASGGAVLVGNHRADIDNLLVSRVVPRFISWVSAPFIDKMPLLGFIYWKIGSVGLNTKRFGRRSYLYRLMELLAAGEMVGIFPEGHEYILKNDFSAPLAPFHPGFAQIAYKAKVPVLPFAILPIHEQIRPVRLPVTLQRRLGWPEEFRKSVRLRTKYKEVIIAFARPISVAEFDHLPKKQAIAFLTDTAQQRISELQRP